MAYREAARSMVEYKLTERLIAKMEALERASTWLAWVAIIVGAIVTLAPFGFQWWFGRQS